jgi:hypothetical protein
MLAERRPPSLRQQLEPRTFTVPAGLTLPQLFRLTEQLVAQWEDPSIHVGRVGHRVVVDTGCRLSGQRSLLCSVTLATVDNELQCTVALQRPKSSHLDNRPKVDGQQSAGYLSRLATQLNTQLNQKK